MTSMGPATPSAGAALRAARLYDHLVWLATLGREGRIRQRLLQLARVASGESILDAGCGTGTLAIAAARHAGPAAVVHGIDVPAEMVAYARAKAGRAGVAACFDTGSVQALPFAERSSRQQFGQELRRVTKPGGRVLLVDFAHATRRRRGHLGLLHGGHGSVDPLEIIGLLKASGFDIVDSGKLGMLGLHFALGSVLGQALGMATAGTLQNL